MNLAARDDSKIVPDCLFVTKRFRYECVLETLVVVTSTDLSPHHIFAIGQFVDNLKSPTLDDRDFFSNVAEPDSWILPKTKKDLAVIGEKLHVPTFRYEYFISGFSNHR